MSNSCIACTYYLDGCCSMWQRKVSNDDLCNEYKHVVLKETTMSDNELEGMTDDVVQQKKGLKSKGYGNVNKRPIKTRQSAQETEWHKYPDETPIAGNSLLVKVRQVHNCYLEPISLETAYFSNGDLMILQYDEHHNKIVVEWAYIPKEWYG